MAGKILRLQDVDADGFGCLEACSVVDQDKFIAIANLDNADNVANPGVRQRVGDNDKARWMPIDFQVDKSFRLQSRSDLSNVLTVFAGGNFKNGTGMCVHNEKDDNSLFYAEFV